ncbi:hypothetical protein GCM10010423_42180 [Streptomyces levis]|uniref:Ascorbate-specific PTS system EIIC component n=1 Tax=Streptomyces levis TaxID=285566 RepID=A0ABP6B5D8_9ACTN
MQGIAERVVPGAKPALDAPIVFPYAQNCHRRPPRGVAGSFLNGVLITFLPALLWRVLGDFGDADFGWFGDVLGMVAELDGAAGMLAVGVMLLVGAWLVQVRFVDRGWIPCSASTRYAKIAPPAGAPTPPPPPQPARAR